MFPRPATERAHTYPKGGTSVSTPNRIKRLRLRTSGGIKPLLCYLICFALPLLWQYAGLWMVYPYKLAHTAPAIADTLLKLLPLQPAALEAAAMEAALPTASDPSLWSASLSLRDEHWQLYVAVCFVFAWAATLLIQLGWRIRHSKGLNAAKLCRHAKTSYRIQLFIIMLVNAAVALLVYLSGVQHIPGRTAWDYLVYFPAYLLNVLAAMLCFRLAAPPAISGKHAFFKRL